MRASVAYLATVPCLLLLCTVESCSTVDDTAITGADMIPYTLFATSAEQCCNECTQMAGCLAATYDAQTSACHLKNVTDATPWSGMTAIVLSTPTAVPPTTQSPPRDRLLWMAQGVTVLTKPLVAGGVVFVVTESLENSYTYIHATTGDLRWSISACSQVSYIPRPIYNDGTVFFAASSGNPPSTILMAINAASGTIQWSTTVDSVRPIDQNTKFSVSGNVFALALNYELIAVDVNSGVVLYDDYGSWRDTDVHNNLVCACAQTSVVCNDTQGVSLWHSSRLTANELIMTDEVVCAAYGPLAPYNFNPFCNLTALDASTGAPLWTSEVCNPLIVKDGTLLTASTVDGYQSVLTALNASTGALMWTQMISVENSKQIRMDSGTLVGQTNGGLWAVSSATGELLWAVPEYPGQFPFEVANGTVYVFDFGGVSALSATTGTQLWSWTGVLANGVGLVINDNVLYGAAGNVIFALQS